MSQNPFSKHASGQSVRSSSICLKCGGKLIVRTSTRGKEVGNKFLGCENYPSCRYIKDLE